MNKDKFLIDESEVHYESLRLAFTTYGLSYHADWTLNERVYDYIRARERKAYTELANVVDDKVKAQIAYYHDLSVATLDRCFELVNGDVDAIDYLLDIRHKLDEYYG